MDTSKRTAPRFYSSNALGTSGSKIYSIVGTTSNIYTLATLPDLVAGGSGELDSVSGAFSTQTESGITISGTVDTQLASVNGSVLQPDGTSAGFGGVRSGTTSNARMINLSSRARVGTGQNVAIAGFYIKGSQPREMLLRAVGPGLVSFDVDNALTDPRIKLLRGQSIIASNDDWSAADNADDISAAMDRTGAFPIDPSGNDAALLLDLQPDLYTAIVEGATDSGVALVEIYDASQDLTDQTQRLANLSTRGLVGSGDDTLILGFFVTGNAPKRILARGVGPILADFGIDTPLSDPMLTIYQGNTQLAQNDDWGSGPNTAQELINAADSINAISLETGASDAAILITLAPGAYTLHVTSADGSTGIALAEIYEIPAE